LFLNVFLLVDGRLRDFTIGVTNTLPTAATGPDKLPREVCLHFTGVFPASTEMLTCTAIARGRYLFIQIEGDGLAKDMLTICEVEVFCKHTSVGFDRLILLVTHYKEAVIYIPSEMLMFNFIDPL